MMFISIGLFFACTSFNESVAQSKISADLISNSDLPIPTQQNTVDEQLEQLDDPSELSIELMDHGQWDALLKTYVSNDGKVNYAGLMNDHGKLKSYIESLASNSPKMNWSRSEKLAYWINAYNALTVDLILRNYPIKSIKDIGKPWHQRLWQLGLKKYDLDEIEHQILRKMNEPRIHFAIVCASYSCPKLLNSAYTAGNLEDQLSQSTRDFLADERRNVISTNNLRLSKIFQWFTKDFTQNGTLIDFLNQYSTVQISSQASKRYMDYNWNLNE